MKWSGAGGYVVAALVAAVGGCDRGQGSQALEGAERAPAQLEDPPDDGPPEHGETQEPEARAERGETSEPKEAAAPARDVQAAVRATATRLRDCDLSGPFSFFFDPGSAALRPEEANRAQQLNHCLARAKQPRQLVVTGYAELGSDAQSGVSLGLSRAHNVAQRVAMDGAAPRGVVLQTPPPLDLAKDDAPWARRVEVRLRP